MVEAISEEGSAGTFVDGRLDLVARPPRFQGLVIDEPDQEDGVTRSICRCQLPVYDLGVYPEVNLTSCAQCPTCPKHKSGKHGDAPAKKIPFFPHTVRGNTPGGDGAPICICPGTWRETHGDSHGSVVDGLPRCYDQHDCPRRRHN